ncbi:MAG: hypothetical protein ACLGHS_00305 [Actinomycetes bacterium]
MDNPPRVRQAWRRQTDVAAAAFPDAPEEDVEEVAALLSELVAAGADLEAVPGSTDEDEERESVR